MLLSYTLEKNYFQIRSILFILYYFSSSFPFVTQIRGHMAGISPPPLLRYAPSLFFARRVHHSTAFSSLVDSRRIVHVRRYLLPGTTSSEWFVAWKKTFLGRIRTHVEALTVVRWATGKILTKNRQPKLSRIITLSPPIGRWGIPVQTGQIRVDVPPTRGSNFWAPRDTILQVRHVCWEVQLFFKWEVQLFFKKASFLRRVAFSNSWPKPISPFIC